MAWPRPQPGLVIRYSYLWARDHARGQEEGVKDRPCAIILVSALDDGDEVVTVLPITHSPPLDPELAIELPQSTKARLGLDGERSRVVLSEVNRFVWPGPDLRPRSTGDLDSVVYGPLPFALFETIRIRFVAVVRQRRAARIQRTT